MAHSNKGEHASDRRRDRIRYHVRAWMRSYGLSIQRDILHGAATKLGSSVIGLAVLWIEARR